MDEGLTVPLVVAERLVLPVAVDVTDGEALTVVETDKLRDGSSLSEALSVGVGRLGDLVRTSVGVREGVASSDTEDDPEFVAVAVTDPDADPVRDVEDVGRVRDRLTVVVAESVLDCDDVRVWEVETVNDADCDTVPLTLTVTDWLSLCEALPSAESELEPVGEAPLRDTVGVPDTDKDDDSEADGAAETVAEGEGVAVRVRLALVLLLPVAVGLACDADAVASRDALSLVVE